MKRESSDMVEAIADCLIEDHIAILQENATLKDTINLLRNSLTELLDEYHPSESWTDAHIEYENQQGNMMAPVVRRAKDALQAAIRTIGEKE